MEYLSSIVLHTVQVAKTMSIGRCGILSMAHTPIYQDLKREKSINVASMIHTPTLYSL